MFIIYLPSPWYMKIYFGSFARKFGKGKKEDTRTLSSPLSVADFSFILKSTVKESKDSSGGGGLVEGEVEGVLRGGEWGGYDWCG